MKLLTYEAEGSVSFGVAKDDGVVDLAPHMSGTAGLLGLLRDGALSRAKEIAAGRDPDHGLDEITYLRPVPFPEKTICVGVNYAKRNEEYDDTTLPPYPSIFMRTPGSLVGHGADIMRPPETEQFDYEGEIAIVIGKGGRRIPEDQALSHIGGLTCCNEGTVRDWLRHGKFNVTQGKNFERTGAIGPWLVTADEFDRFDDLRVTTRVNGEVRQDDTTANLIFDFRYLIRYISTWTELKPGDVISTGTPIGAGASMKPPSYLVAGDRVEVEVPGIGTLSNIVVDEPTG